MRKLFLFVALIVFTIYSNAQDLTISGGNSVSTMICSNGAVFTWGNNAMGPAGNKTKGALGTGNTPETTIQALEKVLLPS